MIPTDLEVRAGRIDGAVTVPGSKSVTHRSFLLAAQSTKPCTVTSPLLSADTWATLSCLLALGARFRLDSERPEAVQFQPMPFAAPHQALDCANSGTTLRLMAGTAARLTQPITLTGDASLQSRPNGTLLDALSSLGVRATSNVGKAPLTVRGPLRSGAVTLPPASSSQFASSLLLALPFVAGASTLTMAPPVSSSPYLDVTLDVAARAGLRIAEDAASGRTFRFSGNQSVTATELPVDGDWSSAAFLFAAAAVTGGGITVHGLDAASRQGDRRILNLLASFGADVLLRSDGVRVNGGSLETPGEINVAATPDLFPVLCVVAAASRGCTTFTGGASLRSKETDRIASMAQGLRAMGIKVQEQPDGLQVEGGRLQGASVASHGDHRIHMAFAVAGLAARGLTRIDDATCADVSYPGFHDALSACGAPFTLLQGNHAGVAR